MLGVSRRRGHLRALARGLPPLGGDVEEDALLSLVRSKAAHGNERDAVVERVARHATERVRGGSAKRDAPGGIHTREGVPRASSARQWPKSTSGGDGAGAETSAARSGMAKGAEGAERAVRRRRTRAEGDADASGLRVAPEDANAESGAASGDCAWRRNAPGRSRARYAAPNATPAMNVTPRARGARRRRKRGRRRRVGEASIGGAARTRGVYLERGGGRGVRR